MHQGIHARCARAFLSHRRHQFVGQRLRFLAGRRTAVLDLSQQPLDRRGFITAVGCGDGRARGNRIVQDFGLERSKWNKGRVERGSRMHGGILYKDH